MSDPALSARRPLLDERGYRATLVTADPLELRPGAGVESKARRRAGRYVLRLSAAPEHDACIESSWKSNLNDRQPRRAIAAEDLIPAELSPKPEHAGWENAD